MQINDIYAGFRLKQIRPIPEIEANMWELVYEKNGAELIYLERPDDNKTFAISFKTIPNDDTGVFHILEHSVLCGSRKYPSKDPFVELLKGSLQTFLNAMTFNDKTMYPVSSRNDRDFLNLVDVYMDAVLHPMLLEKEEIFMQEGWHIEVDEDGKFSYKGVVFNEMKGAYSSADEVMSEEIMKALYPDVCYSQDSGGDPRYIPTLTYEQICEAHRTFYSPSNARIFLDGKMNLEEVLDKLDSFLAEFDPVALPEFNLVQPKVVSPTREGEYEIAENEDENKKTRLTLGFGAANFDEIERLLAISCLCDTVAGSNEAPLKKAFLDAQIADDMSLSLLDGIATASVILELRGMNEEDIEDACALLTDTVEEIINGGIDKKRLTACLNSMEFRLCERDYGSMPRGLIYGISIMDSWLYGGDPILPLTLSPVLAELRAHLEADDGYYESILAELFLANEHLGAAVLKPSKTLAARRLADEEARLAKIKEAMSEEEIEALKEKNARLLQWQQEEDTEEILAMLPSLSLDDVSEDVEPLPIEVKTLRGTTLISHKVATAGIDYVTLRFSVNDFTPALLPRLSLLSALLTRLDTTDYSALELESEIQTYLGSLSFAPEVLANGQDTQSAKVFLSVSIGALKKNRAHILRLLPEIFYETKFENKEQIRNLVHQWRLGFEDSYAGAGHVNSMNRAGAYIHGYMAANEAVSGLEYYRYLRELDKNFDAMFDEEMQTLSDLTFRLFDRERLTLSLTGECDEKFAAQLLSLIPAIALAPAANMTYKPLGLKNEGIRVPSQVSYASLFGQLDSDRLGTFAVARNILSFAYLWGEIRVKGGAYGAGFSVRKNGGVAFYSYRDPSAARSVGVYESSPAFLRAFAEAACEDGVPVKFIIGALGAEDPIRTPRTMGSFSDTEYLLGRTHEDTLRRRRELLSTTKEDLLALADKLEELFAEPHAVCVIGADEKLQDALAQGKIAEIVDL